MTFNAKFTGQEIHDLFDALRAHSVNLRDGNPGDTEVSVSGDGRRVVIEFPDIDYIAFGICREIMAKEKNSER